MKKIILLSAFCSSLLLATGEVEELKMQLQQQSEMIKALTKRLDQLENHESQTSSYAESEKIPSFESTSENTAQVNTSSFAQPQYVPDISLVIDTSFVARNKRQDELNHLGTPGIGNGYFGEGGHEGHAHSSPNGDNGFNFNYAELVLSSNIDPYFSLDAVIHFSEDDVEMEEAYFTTTALEGIRIKGGKFFSDFGRLNKQHHHVWDFSDAPLIYQGFLGTDGINEKGIQFQYTLPTSNYMMVGAEILQGENETSFGNEAIELGNGHEIEGASAPSLFVAYLKGSTDIGSTTVMPGFSFVHGDTRSSHFHDGHEEAFKGRTDLYNLELTVKHYFDSYSYLSWQSEWIQREQTGTMYHVDNGQTEEHDQKLTQSGLYSQVVYGMNQSWHMGARYDSIYRNDVGFSEEEIPSTPYERYSAMTEYHFSEFSRLRLQYNYNTSLYNEDLTREDIHSLILSFNFAIGAHGAHDF